jgi:disulfide oxidoreductase YuzD/DNA-binding protein H-NS
VIGNAKGGTINWLGDTLSTEEASKKLKGYEDSMKSSMNTLNEYDSKLELVKKAKGETTLETIKLDEATQKEVGSILKLDEASKNSVDGLGAAEGAVDSLGRTTDETVNSLDKLTNEFSKFQAPIELLKTIQEELSKSGGLTDETYRKVLTSGDERIIAILSNRDTALQNTKDLLKEYLDSESEAAKNLIDNAANSVNALNGVNNKLENAHEKATELFKAQAKSSEGIDLSNALGGNYDDLMNPLIDSLGIAKDKVDEFEKYLIDSITEYVNQGGQLYAVDAETKAAFDQAKMNSGEVWKNKEFTDLANHILDNKNQYDADAVNWANAIIDKNYSSADFSNETMLQIANMVLANSENYSAEAVNWANAINSKVINNNNMVADVITKIAQMILANSKNYSADAVNWANAIVNNSFVTGC